MAIAIIDYRKGNLRSVQKGIEMVGGEAYVSSDPLKLKRATALVLPGVGAFADAMETMYALGLIEPVCDAIERGVPFLGICLGLHLLFDWGEEGGTGHTEGLGIFAGKCDRLPNEDASGNRMKIPHVGWNTVAFDEACPLFSGVPQNSHFYFTHSFKAVPAEQKIIAGTTVHGLPFTSAVWRDNVFGVQFHPEKSSTLGLRVLKNFVRLS